MPTSSSAVVDALAQRGYAVVRDALPPAVIDGLRERAHALDAAGALVPATVRSERANIRGDRIAWLATPQTEAEASFLDWLLELRIACNRELMLGLVDFEGHYASYPPGAGYARHRDRFRDDDARVLSCVLYLNEAWRADDGGALRVHLSRQATLDVLPEAGTFVAFLAADFDHEVRPARRERLAMTGWLRRRARIFSL
jgi:SM-20-related protein